ncbi:DUF5960 family protein [Enterococcus faecium]|uniref:DUF5960 family protein n=1 Tax=Enterococcus faecium TaxID=1352 RepID=UPI00129C52DD|nr:DUF5960 family protein [Enterococcus faecium]MRI46071.1 hypothetical protein [Enterococcus faecium]
MLMEGKTQLWFKFDPSNRFVKDFYKVWDSEVFFLAIEDSLLINLYYSNKNYFKIPATKTWNGNSFFDKFYKVQNFFPYAIPIVLDNEPPRM